MVTNSECYVGLTANCKCVLNELFCILIIRWTACVCVHTFCFIKAKWFFMTQNGNKKLIGTIKENGGQKKKKKISFDETGCDVQIHGVCTQFV